MMLSCLHENVIQALAIIDIVCGCCSCNYDGLYSQIWWAIGSMFGALLAYGVMGPDRLGWHWYLGLAAIPLALVLLFFPV